MQRIYTIFFFHQTVPRQPNPVPTVVGGYSAAAIHATGATYSGFGSAPPTTTRRYHAHQASFSRRTTVGQIEEFLCQKFSTKLEVIIISNYSNRLFIKLYYQKSHFSFNFDANVRTSS